MNADPTHNEWKYYIPSIASLILIAFMYTFPMFIVFILSAGVFLFALIYALMVKKFLALRKEFLASGGTGDSPSEPSFRNVTVTLIKKGKDNWGI
jgi:hypothetical protein